MKTLEDLTLPLTGTGKYVLAAFHGVFHVASATVLFGGLAMLISGFYHGFDYPLLQFFGIWIAAYYGVSLFFRTLLLPFRGVVLMEHMQAYVREDPENRTLKQIQWHRLGHMFFGHPLMTGSMIREDKWREFE